MRPTHATLTTLAILLAAGCQGRGRRDLTLTPKPKAQQDQVEKTNVLFQTSVAHIPLSFPANSPEVKQVSLRGLLCQDVTNPLEQTYVAKDAHSGELVVALSVKSDASGVTCSSIAVINDKGSVYSGVIAGTSVPKDPNSGDYTFPQVLLSAGLSDDIRNSNQTVTVDGTILTCDAPKKFDTTTKQCK